MNGTEILYKIIKGKQVLKVLFWDDDFVIIVNMIIKGKNFEYNIQFNGSFKFSIIFQRFQFVCSSFIKICLFVLDFNGFISVSSGLFSKFRKKGLSQINVFLVKLGLIDNFNFIIFNNLKVGKIFII